MRCVAVIAVRNGIDYIDGCLSHLFNNGIEVAVIDQMSSDGTYEFCESLVGNGICSLKQINYPGFFSLAEQLQEKQKLIASLKTDWVIHQDIDEILECPEPGFSLLDGLQQQSSAGYDVVNFHEYVFIPHVFESQDFYQSCYYYYFQPSFPRLMRSWRKSKRLEFINGGHHLMGEFKLSPVNFNLRHYIFTSQSHAYEKYLSRTFSEKDIENGWHGNRMAIPKANFLFPNIENLSELSDFKSSTFDQSSYHSKHYWEWS